GIKALRAIAETDFGVNTSTEQAIRMMVLLPAPVILAEGGVTDDARATARAPPRREAPLR
ncbi:TetR family transcriptional regulator, partial [Pseudomonas ogarae]